MELIIGVVVIAIANDIYLFKTRKWGSNYGN